MISAVGSWYQTNWAAKGEIFRTLPPSSILICQPPAGGSNSASAGSIASVGVTTNQSFRWCSNHRPSRHRPCSRCSATCSRSSPGRISRAAPRAARCDTRLAQPARADPSGRQYRAWRVSRTASAARLPVRRAAGGRGRECCPRDLMGLVDDNHVPAPVGDKADEISMGLERGSSDDDPRGVDDARDRSATLLEHALAVDVIIGACAEAKVGFCEPLPRHGSGSDDEYPKIVTLSLQRLDD